MSFVFIIIEKLTFRSDHSISIRDLTLYIHEAVKANRGVTAMFYILVPYSEHCARKRNYLMFIIFSSLKVCGERIRTVIYWFRCPKRGDGKLHVTAKWMKRKLELEPDPCVWL